LPAESVIVEFYQIDNWAPEDKFFVVFDQFEIGLVILPLLASAVTMRMMHPIVKWESEVVSQDNDLGFSQM
jgi:hypothetical protein